MEKITVDIEEIMMEIRKDIRRKQDESRKMDQIMREIETEAAKIPQIAIPDFNNSPQNNLSQSVGWERAELKEVYKPPILKQIENEANYLKANSVNAYYFDLGHGLKSFIKRIVRKLNKPLIYPLSERQSTYNEHVANGVDAARIIGEMQNEQIQQIQAELSKIYDLLMMQRKQLEMLGQDMSGRENEFAEYREQIKAQDELLKLLEKDISGQEDEIAAHREQLKAQGEQLEVLGQDMSGQGDELAAHREQLKAQDEQLEVLGQDMSGQGAELAAHRERLKTQGEQLEVLGQDMSGQGDELAVHREQLKVLGQDVSGHGDELAVHREQLKVLGQDMSGQGDELAVHREQLKVLGQDMSGQGAELAAHREQLKVLGQDMSGQGDELAAHREQLKAQGEQLEVLGQDMSGQGDELAVHREQLKAQGERLEVLGHDMSGQGAELAVHREQLSSMDHSIDQLSLSVSKVIRHYLEKPYTAADTHKEYDETADATADDKTENEDIIGNKYTSLDYFQFQNDFRGSQSQIMERQRVYLPYVKGKNGRIFDLGCGRGEFLRLLKEEGIPAFGVDTYPEYEITGQLYGVDITVDDGISVLENMTESLGGIFCAQVIEHLGFSVVQKLCRLALEKLEKGGCLILETPNPMCVSAMTNAFYLDPTHDKPVHPLLMEYLLKNMGFSEVELIWPDHSLPQLPALQSDSIQNLDEVNRAIERVSNLLYGSQDYAVIAIK